MVEQVKPIPVPVILAAVSGGEEKASSKEEQAAGTTIEDFAMTLCTLSLFGFPRDRDVSFRPQTRRMQHLFAAVPEEKLRRDRKFMEHRDDSSVVRCQYPPQRTDTTEKLLHGGGI